MNSQWQAHLEQQGATIDENLGVRFSEDMVLSEVLEADLMMAALSHLGVIAVSGEDAGDFLQSQFANDVSQVTDTRAQLNAYCSPKGRILSTFRIFRDHGVYYLVMPCSVVASTLKRLSLFVLRSKVEIKDLSDDLVGIGVAGAEAEAHLQQTLGSFPAEDDDVVHGRELNVIRVSGQPARFLIFGSADTVQVLWDQLRTNAKLTNGEAWTALDIRAGLPEIPLALQDQWVPQMVNLHALEGISFKKGCYPGQEIVARTEYLGKLKRRMYRVRIGATTAPQPGDEVFDGEEPAKGVGRIVSAAGDPEQGYEALAVLQIEGVEGRDLRLGSAEGPRLTLLELPYSLETG